MSKILSLFFTVVLAASVSLNLDTIDKTDIYYHAGDDINIVAVMVKCRVNTLCRTQGNLILGGVATTHDGYGSLGCTHCIITHIKNSSAKVHKKSAFCVNLRQIM